MVDESTEPDRFLYPMGTNVAFGRTVLVDLGGFDEQFEYYLDETDLVCRLRDEGHRVVAVDDAFVHHKYLPSYLRNPNRTPRVRFPVVKNRVYFALRHGLNRYGAAHIASDRARFIEDQRAEIRNYLANGAIDAQQAASQEEELQVAVQAGLACWHEGPRLRPTSFFDDPGPFLPFGVHVPRGRRLHLCLLTEEHPPDEMGVVGRHVLTLSRLLAAAGHVVRVFTTGRGHDRVDLDRGVWVHRLVPRHHDLPAAWSSLPQAVWDRTCTLRDAVLAVHQDRSVDLVQGPNRGQEALALVEDGTLQVAIGVYGPEAPPLIPADRWCCQHADLLVASTRSLVDEIERTYDVVLPPDRIVVVPNGDAESDPTSYQRDPRSVMVAVTWLAAVTPHLRDRR